MRHRTTSPPDTSQLDGFQRTFDALCDNVEQVVRGKRPVVQLAAICMFAGGHLLVEDVPGVGKTVLSKSLARSIGGRFGRIQFTPDLLPSDVIGTSVWNQGSGEFTFHPGPVFSNVVLADEVNRASPKTQSALLEAMAENQVTVDGQTHRLQSPFMVIATQNPLEHHGTYPLPESQLDRFLINLSIGYPDKASEVDLLLNSHLSDPTESITATMDIRVISEYSALIDSVHVSTSVAEYLVSLATTSRTGGDFVLGISPRALIGLLSASKVLAAAQGRPFVSPDDIKQLAVHVLAHRVVPAGTRSRSASPADAIRELLDRTPVPA